MSLHSKAEMNKLMIPVRGKQGFITIKNKFIS
jgi:hypothetical protein